jgi:hypothetical protein
MEDDYDVEDDFEMEEDLFSERIEGFDKNKIYN